MDPIAQHSFSLDYHRFVTQDLFREMPPQGAEPQKKFDLKGADKSEKAKKDKNKDEEDKEGKKRKKPFDM